MSTLTATPTTTLPATMTMREASRLRATFRLIEAGQIPVIRTGRRIHVITRKVYTMLGIPLDQPVAEAVDQSVTGDVPELYRTVG